MSSRPRFFLGSFQPVLPRFRIEQAASLAWLAEAHAAATRDRPEAASPELLLKVAQRFGCGPSQIRERFHEPEDFSGRPTPDSLVFAPLSRRMGFYGRALDRVFAEFYPEEAALGGRSAPAELLHVSCTGYLSPSAAQIRVAQLGWGNQTRVTHAYHMGCYAALPALRMAQGSLLREALHSPSSASPRIDVAHTEICSLHFRPGVDAADQWVIQSLFADGFIRYELTSEPRGDAALELLTTDEVLVPGTRDQMTWVPEEQGFAMTLGREVPREIARGVGPFVERLLARLDVAGEASDSRTPCFYAVHPGGPKIVDAVEETLGLSTEQTLHSREILRSRGNLSSATLPHIWDALLKEREIPHGARVVSLAFGPGLTLCGSVFRVHRKGDPRTNRERVL